jgi:hypothetical protein
MSTHEHSIDGGTLADLERRLSGDLASLDELAHELARLRPGGAADALDGLGHGDATLGDPRDLDVGGHLNADPATVEQGLAKLVLSLIELLRRLMEKQALRRIDAGSLTDDEIERMGETFLKLERKMDELKATFGLTDRDLNLNLGPIGDLIQDA